MGPLLGDVGGLSLCGVCGGTGTAPNFLIMILIFLIFSYVELNDLVCLPVHRYITRRGISVLPCHHPLYQDRGGRGLPGNLLLVGQRSRPSGELRAALNAASKQRSNINGWRFGQL